MLTPDDITILNTWRDIGDRWSVTAKRIHAAVEWCMTHKTMKGIDEMDYAFDPSGINPNFGGGPALPVGKHPVTITKSEGKPTKDNTGGYIELTCVAFDGPAKGGSIPIRLNLHNTSETAVRIAKEQLAAICAVTGVGPFQNTNALHDKAFVIEVAPQANSNYTEVVAVFDMNGNEPGKQQPGGNGGGGNGGFGGGGGATGTGSIPDQGQQQQGGGNGGFGGGNAGGGAGAGAGGGSGGGWQQGGGGNAGGGGGSPGWGQR